MSLANQWMARARRWVHAPVEVPLVCEIASDYICAIRHQRGRVEAWVVEPLPTGAIRPGPVADNFGDPSAVQQIAERLLRVVRNGERRCSLILPDLVARVVLLEFDQFPSQVQEAEDLLRWRLGKDLPFDPHQAVLSYQLQPGREAVQEVLVAVGLREVLRQYETRLEALGLEAGRVSLSTLATLGWLQPAEGTASLLVKNDPASLSVAILRDQGVRLFRSVPLAAGMEPSEETLLEKIYPAVVHFQDRWGERIGDVLVAGRSRANAALARRLAQETGSTVRELDLVRFDLPPSPVSAAAPDSRLAACLGWVQAEAA